MKLTLKQQRFVEAYLGAANGNATQAARYAGYRGNDNTLRVVGAENLAKPAIQAAIAERTARAAQASKGKILSAEEVLSLLSRQAAVDMADLLDDDGNPSIERARETGSTRLIRKVRPTRNGVAIELLDPLKAQELLGKYHGLWSDQTVVDIHVGEYAQDLIQTVLSVLAETIEDSDLRSRVTKTLFERLQGGA